MRKFLATIALVIIMIGTLAPVSFSVSKKTTAETKTSSIDRVSVGVQKAFASIPSGGCPDDKIPDSNNENCIERPSGGAFCGKLDVGCWIVVGLVDYILLPIPSFVATLAGVSSDFFLSLSINPAVYGLCPGGACDPVATGIRTAWSIVRDFSNIGFIFALFVAAFMLILDKTSVGGSQFEPKKVVVRVVIMALLVNFSLFFCRMIVQSADIFSHVLYSKIDASADGSNDTGLLGSALKNAGISSPSLALIAKVNPQGLLLNSQNKAGSVGAYVVISIISFFLYFVFIFLFIQMLFIFAGRIFGLWMGMILSPLAFVSYAVPFIEKNQYIGFDNWLKNFVKLAFTTPVFLFFLYLTISILDVNFGSTILTSMAGLKGSSNWFIAVFYIVLEALLPLTASIFILMYGKKVAIDMAGVVGEMAGKISGTVSGLALGAATGGTALLARQTVGRAGSALAESNLVKSGMTSNNMLTKNLSYGLNSAGRKLDASTFDVRDSKFATGAINTLGREKIDMGSKFKNTGGFAEEGGIRDNLRKVRLGIEESKIERDKKIAEQLAPGKSSNAARDLRDREDKLAQTKQARAAEESKVNMEAENQNVAKLVDVLKNTRSGLTNDPTLKQNITDRTNLKTTQKTLETKEKDLNDKIKILEVKESSGTISVTERAELTTHRTDLTTTKADISNTKEEIKKIDSLEKVKEFDKVDKQVATLEKALANEKDPAKRANMTIREVKQQKANMQILADNSQEKAQMDKKKEAMDKEVTAFTELDTAINKLASSMKRVSKDPSKGPNSQEYKDLEKEFTAKRAKREEQYNKKQKAKTEFDEAEQAYNKAHGNDIKALDSVTKEAEGDYKKDEAVRNRFDILDKKIAAAQMSVNDAKNNIENIEYNRKAKMVENLEKGSKPLIKTSLNEDHFVEGWDTADSFLNWKQKVNKIGVASDIKGVGNGLISGINSFSTGSMRSGDAVRNSMKK